MVRLGHLLERLKKDFKDPLFRNAHALLANALGTSLLGFLYWVLAARFYSPGLVGASSALIAALLLASTVAQLNLGVPWPASYPGPVGKAVDSSSLLTWSVARSRS